MDRQQYQDDEGNPLSYLGAGSIALGVFGVVLLILGLSTYYTIPQYERGILTRNGAFVAVIEPGLHFKMPWIDSIDRINMQEIKKSYTQMESYTADGQQAWLNASIVVSPRYDKLPELYSKYKTVENAYSVIIDPIVPSQVKVVFGRYIAQSAISKREGLNTDSAEQIKQVLAVNPIFNIIRVPIENIEFSKEYIKSIEERMKSEVEVAKRRQIWETEKIAADIVRTQADANAYSVKAKGDAEAAAIEAQGKALSANPRYVEMLQAQRWNGELPQNLSILPYNTIPMFNANPNQK